MGFVSWRKGKQNIRPFGSAILDGIDLDIEDHKSGGYAQLVKSLRELEKTGAKRYLITGAPQCPFPDASLGPKPGTALGDQGAQFDHVYVQFYNNFCHTGDQAQFYPNMDKWLQFAAAAKEANDLVMVLKKRVLRKGPKIFVGMPSATGGAGHPKFYRTPEEVAKIYERLKNKPEFGGFMIWDAAWDQQNVIKGRVYSDHIAGIISRSASGFSTASTTGVPPAPTPFPTAGIKTTPGASPTPEGSSTPGASKPPAPTTLPVPGGSSTPAASKPTTSPLVPATSPSTPVGGGGGGADFCKGKEDGDYADPNNPSGYISCSGGITYKRPCPGGLVWNKEKKICDWPQRKAQVLDVTTNHQPFKQDYQPNQQSRDPVKPGWLSAKSDDLPYQLGHSLVKPDRLPASTEHQPAQQDNVPVKSDHQPVQPGYVPVNVGRQPDQPRRVLIQNKIKALIRILK